MLNDLSLKYRFDLSTVINLTKRYVHSLHTTFKVFYNFK